MANNHGYVGPSGRSRAEWEALIGQYERGDLARKRFCAEASVSVSSFEYWRKKLKKERRQVGAPSRKPEPGFIELPPIAIEREWDVELELGAGVVLRLRRA